MNLIKKYNTKKDLRIIPPSGIILYALVNSQNELSTYQEAPKGSLCLNRETGELYINQSDSWVQIEGLASNNNFL